MEFILKLVGKIKAAQVYLRLKVQSLLCAFFSKLWDKQHMMNVNLNGVNKKSYDCLHVRDNNVFLGKIGGVNYPLPYVMVFFKETVVLH